MDGQMTLAEVAEGIVQYTNEGLGVMIHRSDEMAAAVRAARELLERCEKKLSPIDEVCGDSDCDRCNLIADIRKLIGGAE